MTTPNDSAWDAATKLAEELSGSQSIPLLAADQKTKLSLREAIALILGKTNYTLDLTNRPISPKREDDLFGHILSLRAENLQTLALVVALADHLGIDVEKIVDSGKSLYGK
jgi:hypothetical protein